MPLPWTAPPAHVVLPDVVAAQCVEEPGTATASLLHLRCGPTRMLVVQPRPVRGGVHDEILSSLADLVPSPMIRNDRAPRGRAYAAAFVTTLAQDREALAEGGPSVHLRLVTQVATGLSAACIFAEDGSRRTLRRESAWCSQAIDALLPPPPSPGPATTIEVQSTSYPESDLAPVR